MAEMKREHPSSVGSKKPIPQTFEEAIVSGFHQSQHSRNALLAMLNDIPPAIQSRISMSSLCLDILSLLLELISPKLKPVNPQLYSTREKQQLYDLIDTMINFNLTYRQDRTVEGQYTCSGACRRCGAFSGFAFVETVNLSGEAADCQGDRTGEDEEGGESPAERNPQGRGS
ncbi:chromosome transmission fidelity protein 18 homolog isoform X3 [Carassius auratus]|uniref:Chromosome transmission fidelity protein 18 homolog isoform X3 n=1 Tax=Carassius auratus TaxID=7957 RepID=A0A6P6JKY1_CARAU|nr:chromosome transmission fidelity protein 18 homolog isoform X3 [Carassius auratus]